MANHPRDIDTLVAHEPPIASVLPDADLMIAAMRANHELYQAKGWGAAMAYFIALTSQVGPLPADWLDQPVPDPAAFGLPIDDDGSRDDPLFGVNMATLPGFTPDFAAIAAAPTRVVLGVGEESAGQMTARAATAVAARLAHHRGRVPRRPRWLLGRRVRADRPAGGVRRHAARRARRIVTPSRGAAPGGARISTCHDGTSTSTTSLLDRSPHVSRRRAQPCGRCGTSGKRACFWILTGPWSQVPAEVSNNAEVALVIDTCDLATGECLQVVAHGNGELLPFDEQRGQRKLERYLGSDLSSWDARFRRYLSREPDALWLRVAPHALTAQDLSFVPSLPQPRN